MKKSIGKNRLVTENQKRLIEYKRTPQGKIKFTVWEQEENSEINVFTPTRPIFSKIIRADDLLSFLENVK